MLYADSFLYIMLMLCLGGLWLERVPVATVIFSMIGRCSTKLLAIIELLKSCHYDKRSILC